MAKYESNQKAQSTNLVASRIEVCKQFVSNKRLYLKYRQHEQLLVNSCIEEFKRKMGRPRVSCTSRIQRDLYLLMWHGRKLRIYLGITQTGETVLPDVLVQHEEWLKNVSTSSWHVLFTRLCPARHLCTWLTTYTWFRKVQDVDSACPPTYRVLFHGCTTHLATEALLPPGHVFGTASQYTCATKTSVFRVNSKRFGFNVASGAQCDISINCTIRILLRTK